MSFKNNEKIIKFYNMLLTDITKNNFEINNYKKVINIINQLNYDITINNLDTLQNIKYIGNNTIKRIKDILQTNTTEGIDKNICEKQTEINKLLSIHGIGLVKATKLYDKNITFNNIDEHLKELTHEQCIGVKYKNYINLKIPRKEIDKYKTKITKLLKNYNNILIFDICGSYRRGNLESGDIDLLISSNKNDINLNNLINYLSNKKLLIDHLSYGEKKYMGLSKLTPKSIPRRIDIRVIPKISYYYALLYFTGSAKTNKYMREIAKGKNYKLSEYNLTNNNTNENYLVNSEKDIFDLLDIKYIEPHNR